MKINKKKLSYILAACITLLSFVGQNNVVVLVDAEQIEKVSIEAQLDIWEKNEYPSYIGGVYQETDKNWTIYLTENTEEHQQYLRELFLSDYDLSFRPCQYSRPVLIAAQKEITDQYITNATGSGVLYTDIHCKEWGDGIREPRLGVALSSSDDYDAIVIEMKVKYGGMVIVAVVAESLIATGTAIIPVETTTKKAKTVSVQTVTVKKSILLVKWKKTSGASKYQVKIFKNKKNKKIKTINTKILNCRYSLEKKTNSIYYVRVKAYFKDTKEWGAWSKVIKATQAGKKRTANKIAINKKTASITEKKKITLSVKNSNKKVLWKSSNQKIAIVKSTSGLKKSKAVIQGKKKGTCTITAKIGKKKLKCKLKVKAVVYPQEPTELPSSVTTQGAIGVYVTNIVATRNAISITVKYFNGSNNLEEFACFGNVFSLERWKNGQWEKIETKEPMEFNMSGTLFLPQKECEATYTLREPKEYLTSGQYRIYTALSTNGMTPCDPYAEFYLNLDE